ncbi:serine/threonine-protein kinase [Myxococcus qinghaiensis]|uniref:serine/threonine-protein kinase n=1 Tax=Myxococcus qinghaiensis TaxID=2906758 RepID=UPI0020A750E8|nr:serine/threonine-protein kinase [Myxococcus qinghaiensis]MCP3167887.1 protein kinase [Myxococcus qinghaiensis]
MSRSSASVGTLLGQKYQLRQRIGVGAMGIVYEADGVDEDGAVAIKVLQQHLVDDEAVIARFRREAHAIAGLQHPHLVEVKDFQCNPDEPPFMVMELLHGQTLRLLLKQQGTLPLGRAVAIAIQTLSALETAHRAGVIHRDIKPDNLFIVSDEAGDKVKVLDFGVARLLHEDDASAVGAEAGAWVGTPSFMAPEQVRCQPVDARADLYSLGACLFQMVTGRQPIDVADTVALFSAIVERVPPLASTLRPEVPEEFSRVLARALHKSPAERFADAREMANALRPWAASAHAEMELDDEVTQPLAQRVETAPERKRPSATRAASSPALQLDTESATQFDTTPAPQLDTESATQFDATLAPQLGAEPATRLITTLAPQLDTESATQFDATVAPQLDTESATQFDTTPAPRLDTEPATRLITPLAPQLDAEPARRLITTLAPQLDAEPATQFDATLAPQLDAEPATRLITPLAPQRNARPATRLDAALPADLATVDDDAPLQSALPRRRTALKENLLLVGATLLGVFVGAALAMS